MEILSHRGLWNTESEKNSLMALKRSVELGFGLETDIRDCDGRIVIAHDPPRGGEIPVDLVIDLFNGLDLTLALNIKADGLLKLLSNAILGKKVNWFAFDMSGPESVAYSRAGLPFFTRHSDIEPQPILYESADGVWLDDFEGTWLRAELVRRHLLAGKKVCIVSPELHGRDPTSTWEWLKDFHGESNVWLCTDRPFQAKTMGL